MRADEKLTAFIELGSAIRSAIAELSFNKIGVSNPSCAARQPSRAKRNRAEKLPSHHRAPQSPPIPGFMSKVRIRDSRRIGDYVQRWWGRWEAGLVAERQEATSASLGAVNPLPAGTAGPLDPAP